ncbi:ATP11 protein-domain-containing protein [Mycena sp. CBHHK59/15]|nr:ATP11 protein-domain-containing protein [Mycena sp. CBHHK59/15]
MHRIRAAVRSARPPSLPCATSLSITPRVSLRRCLHANHEDKYAEKLRKAAEKRGLSIDELKTEIKQVQEEQKRQQRGLDLSRPSGPDPAKPLASAPFESVRKDSSPVKPLSSILNIPRILANQHTAEQISALWTVYHASRSNGTGRGYLCAAIPLDLYTKMASAAAKYPIFVADAAHEFYFLQWAFHDAPPIPSASDADLFAPPLTEKPASLPDNPQTSTVMFTPLQEYKMRGSFATPYLVLTNYTDCAHSHGIVLLRGEITPAAASGGAGVDGRYLMTQEDAHRLSMSVQKFYLWDPQSGDEYEEREKLVKSFHNTPDKFTWEELLKHAN